MDTRTKIGIGTTLLGTKIVKDQLKNGNLTGRETVYHNTDKKNINSIKRKGILKSRSYDKNNITHKGLKGSVLTKDMRGLTYVGRTRMPAEGVGLMSAIHNSNDISSKYYNKKLKSLLSRKTIKARIPAWKMEKADNPELNDTKSGKDFAPIVKKRYEKDMPKLLDNKLTYRIMSEIMHKNLSPERTYTLKETIKPEYIKDSSKYKRADKEEVLDYIKNNPERFGAGIANLGLGVGLGAYGINSLKKGIRLKKANEYKNSIEKQASVKKRAVQGILGLSALSAAPNLILGKKKLYQGTSKTNWEDIKKHGLKAEKGGTGASKTVGNSAYQKNSEGKVHLTAIRPIANIYAGANTDEIINKRKELEDFKNKTFNIKVQQGDPGKSVVDYKLKRGYHKHNVEKVKKMEEELRKMNIKQRNDLISTIVNPSIKTNGKTIKVNLDYDIWKNQLEPDREGTMFKKQMRKVKNDNNIIIKNMAARGTIDIPIEQINGSDAKLSDKAKHTMKALPGYIKNNPLRFGAGIASATGGTYLLRRAIKK